MKNLKGYTFKTILECNMCEESTQTSKLLGKRLNQSQGWNPQKKTGITTTIVQCAICGLIFSNPQPIPFDFQDHYGIPPETYWKNEYFSLDTELFRYELQIVKRLLNDQKGIRSLDVGAGIGKCMIALANAGFESYGFEPSAPFYEKAISKMGLSPTRLKLCSIEDSEYPEEYFDFITFGAVLEHLYNPSEAITKAMKWLKKGGLIHIEVPSSNWFINKLINLTYSIRWMDYVGNLSPMHQPFHLYEFSLKSFLMHAKKNNYQIAHHEYFVCDTFMPKQVDFILKPYMRITKQGMQLSIWLRK